FVLHATSFTTQTSITVTCFTSILLALSFMLAGTRKAGQLGVPHRFAEDEACAPESADSL
ncbi:MAG: hypothetical protein ACRDNF_07575, partial [Streptosporangiaceae bacterium]